MRQDRDGTCWPDVVCIPSCSCEKERERKCFSCTSGWSEWMAGGSIGRDDDGSSTGAAARPVTMREEREKEECALALASSSTGSTLPSHSFSPRAVTHTRAHIHTESLLPHPASSSPTILQPCTSCLIPTTGVPAARDPCITLIPDLLPRDPHPHYCATRRPQSPGKQQTHLSLRRDRAPPAAAASDSSSQTSSVVSCGRATGCCLPVNCPLSWLPLPLHQPLVRK